jgi:hypothetical protein
MTSPGAHRTPTMSHVWGCTGMTPEHHHHHHKRAMKAQGDECHPNAMILVEHQAAFAMMQILEVHPSATLRGMNSRKNQCIGICELLQILVLDLLTKKIFSELRKGALTLVMDLVAIPGLRMICMGTCPTGLQAPNMMVNIDHRSILIEEETFKERRISEALKGSSTHLNNIPSNHNLQIGILGFLHKIVDHLCLPLPQRDEQCYLRAVPKVNRFKTLVLVIYLHHFRIIADHPFLTTEAPFPIEGAGVDAASGVDKEDGEGVSMEDLAVEVRMSISETNRRTTMDQVSRNRHIA